MWLSSSHASHLVYNSSEWICAAAGEDITYVHLSWHSLIFPLKNPSWLLWVTPFSMRMHGVHCQRKVTQPGPINLWFIHRDGWMDASRSRAPLSCLARFLGYLDSSSSVSSSGRGQRGRNLCDSIPVSTCLNQLELNISVSFIGVNKQMTSHTLHNPEKIFSI